MLTQALRLAANKESITLSMIKQYRFDPYASVKTLKYSLVSPCNHNGECKSNVYMYIVKNAELSTQSVKDL